MEEGAADHDAVLPRRRTSAASTCSRPRRIRASSSPASSSTSARRSRRRSRTCRTATRAAPNVVSGVNANQLTDIGFGFNNSTANVNLHAQLAPGIRVALTSYLSSRHHNETWVKDGYIQIDQSPIDFVPLKALMEIVTVRVGALRNQLRRRALPPQRQRQRGLQPVRRQLHHGRLHDARSAARCTSRPRASSRWAR